MSLQPNAQDQFASIPPDMFHHLHRCIISTDHPHRMHTEVKHLLRSLCVVQGLFEFRFQLVYTSLEEVLPRVQELWDVAQQSVSKESHQRAKQRLTAIIQVHGQPVPPHSTMCPSASQSAFSGVRTTILILHKAGLLGRHLQAPIPVRPIRCARTKVLMLCSELIRSKLLVDSAVT